ncbi:MAG: cytochrome c nitrite reductase small subunit [Prevotellaceae bacterium]|nr:cytochrome c nitrite reductase small subunit [Prevotellaceae bacterium]
MKTGTFFNRLFPSISLKITAIIACGIVCGLGIYAAYASRASSYLSDEPSVCMNCHIMAPYYATWNHSSHREHANCNDCHVPHQNAVKKWFFKGKDGMRHAMAFTMRGEPQVIRAIDESAAVIMDNCIRCHTQLTSEFVNAGKIDYKTAMNGGGKACWDCHREVPHGGTNSLSSTPSALVPYPASIVPEWLKRAKEKQ